MRMRENPYHPAACMGNGMVVNEERVGVGGEVWSVGLDWFIM